MYFSHKIIAHFDVSGVSKAIFVGWNEISPPQDEAVLVACHEESDEPDNCS